MNFCKPVVIERQRTKHLDVCPDFFVGTPDNFMVRGGKFYAIYDERTGLWRTDEKHVQVIVDDELYRYADELQREIDANSDSKSHRKVVVKSMRSFNSTSWNNYRNYVTKMFDTFVHLDETLIFSNFEPTLTDYASKTLPYPLLEGSIDAYDEIMSTLYTPMERAKLEWAIGAIVSGDSKTLQKFIVLKGPPGTGKSTFLNIVQQLFEGYYSIFEAKALTSNNDAFGTAAFKDNPLVAIDHDGDLSRIDDMTRLNSIVSHEEIKINEKHKAKYNWIPKCFLFVSSNDAAKVPSSLSGITRRMIDVEPSGDTIPKGRYIQLMNLVTHELGAIAHHCLQVYKKMGPNYYDVYKPTKMMSQTNIIFNFVEDNHEKLGREEGVLLKSVYDLFKQYCEEVSIEYKMPRHKFREELKPYFETFIEREKGPGNTTIRSIYRGFIPDKFINNMSLTDVDTSNGKLILELSDTASLLDSEFSGRPAQLASAQETPLQRWDDVRTTLQDVDTSKTHYVRPPDNHIVIDFDLKGDDGHKSLERNLETASAFPPTYSELSKSGLGVHLHYTWGGDVEQLSRIYGDGIEVKVFTGKSALRRKLTKCNNTPIATLNTGLPLKGADKLVNFDLNMNERMLRSMIIKNLGKHYHADTNSSVSYIHKLLDDAYKSNIPYDVTDLRQRVLTFATNSTNNAERCLKLVNKMQFKSEQPSESPDNYKSDELVFFDVEVFRNYFIIVWKRAGGKHVVMVNPSPIEIEPILRMMLVGFNCRRYDNHIVYAAWQGYSNAQLFDLSQRIITNSKNSTISEAYNLSYADVYDFSSTKQSLKKWEIKLRLKHKEMEVDWNEPLPEDKLKAVIDYCCDDVDATEATFENNRADFVARQIIADLSGLKVNDTTQMHAGRFLFGRDQRPYEKFNYVNLADQFKGYTFDMGKSYYRGELVGEGGYVHSEPGSYVNVAVLDVVSMHPWSLRNMNMFGPYQEKFNELLDARVAIKHKDFDKARVLMGGVLAKYIDDPSVDLDALAYALKIVINSVYGFTAAKFENKFKDPRNKDNIVAKRGALFMIDLKHAVQERGFTVAHIKTDSIKISNATPEIIEFVNEFGRQYGYEFEHENTYDRFCLVNNAVYIARDANETVYCRNKKCKHKWKTLAANGVCSECGREYTKWTATGTQFAVPYVFKTLFSKQAIVFDDLCEEKSVTTSMYLQFKDQDPYFIGKVGLFSPIKEDKEGCVLLRKGAEDKFSAVTGTKGYLWLESETVKALGKEDDVDHGYYHKLVDAAIDSISKHCDFEWFVADPEPEVDDRPPWTTPCGKDIPCAGCKENGCNPSCVNKSNHTQIDECIAA